MRHSAKTSFRHIGHEAKALAHAESGVTSIEYALIAALIAVAILVGVTNVGTAVQGLYGYVANAVAAAAAL